MTISHLMPSATTVLTARESEMIRLIARGHSNQQIADELYLSVNSVKTYIRSAYRKIGVTTRTKAILWAYHHDMFDMTPAAELPAAG